MWYVIQVKTGDEKGIARKLQELGIQAVAPVEDRVIRTSGKWTSKEYVIFTGYVFLQMTYNAENYYRVKGTPGVIRFLGDNQSPSTLSYLEAEWIMALAGKDNEPLKPTVVRAAEDGTLQIVSGVLKKFESNITKIDKRSRKAAFEITICNEKKDVQLSIQMEEEKEQEVAE